MSSNHLWDSYRAFGTGLYDLLANKRQCECMRNPIRALAEDYRRWGEVNFLKLNLRKSLSNACPICGMDLRDHTFAVFGGTSFERNAHVELEDLAVNRAAIDHNWKAVIGQVIGSSPALAAVALECPQSKTIACLLEVVPYDYWETWMLLRHEILTPELSGELRAEVPACEWIHV